MFSSEHLDGLLVSDRRTHIILPSIDKIEYNKLIILQWSFHLFISVCESNIIY